MLYNSNFDLTGFIDGDDALYYGNTATVGNSFSGGTQSGQYMGPSRAPGTMNGTFNPPKTVAQCSLTRG